MKAAVSALIAAALLGAAGLWLWRPGSAVVVTIPQGLGAKETAAILKDRGVIPSALAFRLAARYTGADRRLKPGTYRLKRNMPLPRLLEALEDGRKLEIKIVIPEGFSARQIAERLEAEGVLRAAEMTRYAAANRLEGTLFPTTYFFEPKSGVEDVVQRLRREFHKRIGAEYAAAEPKPRLTLHQLVTLASIVEREAVLHEEKPMIAAVYLNRMRLRMRLEADPTVQYALGRWKKGLSSEDLRIPSPYNTYVHYGLPPGPICSPGLDSFRAAVNPARTSAIYFVADNRGGHVFSNTHEEHLKAKQSFKRGLRVIKEKLRREAAEGAR